jgi:predicted DNA-binding transcriptional regulator YafY
MVMQVRRDRILSKLDASDDETMGTLAAEFEVSRNTIYLDIKFLIEELHYPIETVRGNGGGVLLRREKLRYRKNLSVEQNGALERASKTANARDTELLLEIMELFK